MKRIIVAAALIVTATGVGYSAHQPVDGHRQVSASVAPNDLGWGGGAPIGPTDLGWGGTTPARAA